MINSSEVSVVVQGPIDQRYIEKCISSIKRTLPDSEIVLSTWNGMCYNHHDIDRIVLSEDPGTIIQNEDSKIDININRQIISTIEGIKACSRKYVLKLRTDIQLHSDEFLRLFEKYPQRIDALRCFKERLCICNYYTRNPRIINMPFHNSDWVCFGLREDVQKYYDVPLMQEEELQWFKKHKKETRLFPGFMCRYSPEQYFSLYALRSVADIEFESYYDNSKQNIELSEKFLVNNFVIMDYKKNILEFLKYNPNRYLDSLTLFSESDWKELYSKYILKKTNDKKYMLYCAKCFLYRIFWNTLYWGASVILNNAKSKNFVRIFLESHNNKKQEKRKTV